MLELDTTELTDETLETELAILELSATELDAIEEELGSDSELLDSARELTAASDATTTSTDELVSELNASLELRDDSEEGGIITATLLSDDLAILLTAFTELLDLEDTCATDDEEGAGCLTGTVLLPLPPPQAVKTTVSDTADSARSVYIVIFSMIVL